MPQYQQEATNPTGYDPKDLAAMNTAGSQSVGGATAGAVGELGLQAARTGNAGGFAPAADEAVRSGQRQMSANALGVRGANADLKQQQKQAGLSGLASLYGGNTANMLSALGLQNQSTQTGTQAGQSGWFQNMTGLVGALGGIPKPGGK